MTGGARYVPDRGDVVWIDFDPQAGHEQAGRRPALVLSPAHYNAYMGLVVVCPITRQVKGLPFEVPMPPGLPIGGVVFVGHVKSQDWVARRVAFACRVPPSALNLVSATLLHFIG